MSPLAPPAGKTADTDAPSTCAIFATLMPPPPAS